MNSNFGTQTGTADAWKELTSNSLFFKVSYYQLLGHADPSAEGANRQNGCDISIHLPGLAACKSTSKGKDPRAQQLQLFKFKFMIVA